MCVKCVWNRETSSTSSKPHIVFRFVTEIKMEIGNSFSNIIKYGYESPQEQILIITPLSA